MAGVPASGLGLKITRERLESLYGEEQSVELLGFPGSTVMRVYIPFHGQPADGEPGAPDRSLRHAG
jgi:hypothetical protein